MLPTRVIPALALLILCAACGGSSSPTPQAVVGASQQAVNAAWGAAARQGPCHRENLALVCPYLYKGVHISISFDQNHTVEQFQTDGLPHRSVNMWRLLNSLVPAGSRRVSCRFVPNSIGGDTAHACLYHKTSDMVVALFLHPTDDELGGLVGYDYAGYKDVQAS